MNKKEDVSPEDNVITPDEFEVIEKKEGKKPPKPAEKKEVKKEVSGSVTDIEKLVLKTEKLEGKFDVITAERQALSDRISVLNEEIGEIRSSVLGRDRVFTDIQTEFRGMKDSIENISPRSIAANLERGVQGIEVNAVKIEGLDARTKELTKELKKIKTTLFKIRDVQNLVEIIEGLKKKVGIVEKDRKYTSRLAGKVEAMFAEISEKLGELDRFRDKMTLNEDAMHEMMKNVDVIDIRLDQLVKKDDLKKSENDFAKKIEATRTEWDDKIYDVKKLIDELLESLKNAGVKGMLEKMGKLKLKKSFVSKSELDDIRARLENLRGLSDDIKELKKKQFMETKQPSKAEIIDSVRKEIDKLKEQARPEHGKVEKALASEAKTEEPEHDKETAGTESAQPPQQEQAMSEEVRDGVESVEKVAEKLNAIIEQAGEAVRVGQTDIAKSKYLEALSLYNQLSQTTTPEEAEALYANIRKLYNRLRIYG